MTIYAATPWATNADLVAECIELGYLCGDVLDPTYGKGNWWSDENISNIAKLTASDLDAECGVGVADFRNLLPGHPLGAGYDANTFDAVAFDPPYVSPGGRDSSTIKEMHGAYGMGETPRTPRALFDYNMLGFWECVRVVRRGGHVCFKSKDYISSARFQAVTHWILGAALDGVDWQRQADLELVDRLEHIGGGGPQPANNLDGSPRRQVHARRNLSTMLVFRKR